jgi:hypothetical protein
VSIAASGSITGVVAFDSSAPRPADRVVQIADSLAAVCGGHSLRLARMETSRGGIVDALVWISDARRGKPLPRERRFELASDRCQLTPRVQAAIAGGMLNVLSLDAAFNRLLFSRPAVPGIIARVVQFDAGQVVPVESVLRLAGPVIVTSETQPWMRAWITVFDQPYFDQTGARGAFLIDSIPPGRYHLVAWHPAAGRADTTVTISAGETLRLRLELSGESTLTDGE